MTTEPNPTWTLSDLPKGLLSDFGLAVVRLEILTGRMSACHAETGKHKLLGEAEAFCVEGRRHVAEALGEHRQKLGAPFLGLKDADATSIAKAAVDKILALPRVMSAESRSAAIVLAVQVALFAYAGIIISRVEAALRENGQSDALARLRAAAAEDADE